jgi:hypothetical protein
VLGRVQVFKDGSAGYWLDEGEQAKLAATLDVAVRLHVHFEPERSRRKKPGYEVAFANVR